MGTNGRVYIEDDLKYKCAGGRKAEGRYGHASCVHTQDGSGVPETLG